MNDQAEIAIIGMGLAGIATAYYLSKQHDKRSIVLIDPRDPMSYTSAQSGDNYRDWWPSKTMTQFSRRSIELMECLADETNNVFNMQKGGYALVSSKEDITAMLSSLESTYKDQPGQIRRHEKSTSSAYENAIDSHWRNPRSGVDLLSNPTLIKRVFPAFTKETRHVLHIRNAGHISAQQMGAYMLEQIKLKGGRRIRGEVTHIENNNGHDLTIRSASGDAILNADILVNASGPFIADVSAMQGVELPVTNVFHQKLAFEDTLNAVPRNQPFAIDLDPITLNWTPEELDYLSSDASLAWLTKENPGGIHCRPEGNGNWIKLGWAYNQLASQPKQNRELNEDPRHDSVFPEIVIRAASRLNPGLKPYIESLPTSRSHYGGYYTMTRENWPLIGPINQQESFVVGALSGFGAMSACAAGELCSQWIDRETLPDFATALSPSRYDNSDIVNELQLASNLGIL